jgi:Cu2+-exporting ATPase
LPTAGPLGAFAVEDQIRPESKEAVSDVHMLGKRVPMITGGPRQLLVLSPTGLA